ncbi:hypothetical protein HU200_029797 [Digitaria exilis]|uniref:Uncharacterized protein n=1 Tax=Digitaria exilis TaxID=1010633 RepID=A0A835BT04_9POAL|nr:hypothetical protein HU200_029797 [Digitaria exilis]
MASPRRRQRNSVLVAVYDCKVGYLVFRFDVKGLFSDENTSSSTPREVLPFPPNPLACFRRHPHGIQFMALVASPGGDQIVAATDSRRTIVYDAVRSKYSAGPAQRAAKPRPILVAAQARLRRRRHDMLLATTYPESGQQGPHFESFRLEGGGGGSGSGRLRSLPPVPPPPFDGRPRLWGYARQVTSYFAAGERVWLSMDGEGTYSFDMARREWRHEGSWVLPLEERAEYVPELGLLFGFRAKRLFFCACDIKVSPPVIRQEWRWCDLAPGKHEGYSYQDTGLFFSFAGVAYLGGGRFCVSWCGMRPRGGGRRLFALTGVEVTPSSDGKLQLRKRKSRCYLMSPHQTWARVL